MPPNVDPVLLPSAEDQLKNEVEPVVTQDTHEAKRPPMQLVWRNIIWLVYLHVAALYGLFLLPWAKPYTWLWGIVTYMMSGLGITAGAHRLWAHRSYKAKLPLRIILGIFNTMAFQNDIIEWSRDHRVHHKFSETDADPHNATRGFFFSHVGWLLCRKHPDVKAKGKTLDVSDLYADPVCAVQKKIYIPAMILTCFVIPAAVPYYYWGETFSNSFFVCSILRYTLVLNATWLVNSLAHLYGNKPYDRAINPVENVAVALSAMGEGFHNYHHTFPQDYAAGEFGWKINPTTLFIDCMARIGQVTMRNKVPNAMVSKRRERTGDGSEGFGFVKGPKRS